MSILQNPSPFPPPTVQRPDPNQPRPEGDSSSVVKGDPIAVMAHWPHSLEAALQHWASEMPKAACLTTLDTSGRPVHTLTYGEIQCTFLPYYFFIVSVMISISDPPHSPILHREQSTIKSENGQNYVLFETRKGTLDSGCFQKKQLKIQSVSIFFC